MADMIKVRAKFTGFFGQRRRAGDVFEVPADTKLGKWMEKVPETMPIVKQGPSAASLGDKSKGDARSQAAHKRSAKEPETLSAMAKTVKQTSREDEALA
jgi:hypothetical protein